MSKFSQKLRNSFTKIKQKWKKSYTSEIIFKKNVQHGSDRHVTLFKYIFEYTNRFSLNLSYKSHFNINRMKKTIYLFVFYLFSSCNNNFRFVRSKFTWISFRDYKGTSFFYKSPTSDIYVWRYRNKNMSGFSQ